MLFYVLFGALLGASALSAEELGHARLGRIENKGNQETMNCRFSIPVVISSQTSDLQRMLEDLRLAKASRVWIATGIYNDKEKQAKVFSRLGEHIRFFKENGIETGVWFWAFQVQGNKSFTHIHSFEGTNAAECCPLDMDFRAFMQDAIRAIAAIGPDLIMFDDDYSLYHSGTGCICRHHLERVSKELGEQVSEEGLFQRAFGGKPNKLRSALVKSWGDSLREHAIAMRQALDSVNPNIRMGTCLCLNSYDADGVAPGELAILLAGKTRPFLRQIGAPYWAASWRDRPYLEEIVEYERWQQSQNADKNIEIWAEGDVYPRPRYKTPASYLEIFSTALLASGGFEGVMKYMFDYTSSADYERGYLERHVRNLPVYEKICQWFGNGEGRGMRVYFNSCKLKDTDFTGLPVEPYFINKKASYSQAAEALACNSIPTVYSGLGNAGIVFWESARHLPEEAFSRPMILDIAAAKILSEKGMDVGISSFGEFFKPNKMLFPDGERVALVNKKASSVKIEVSAEARICGTFEDEGVASFSYKNQAGRSFLVFNFHSGICVGDFWRNYRFPRTIVDFCTRNNAALPVYAFGNPDLYVLCKDDGIYRNIGAWNCSADEVNEAVLHLDRDVVEIECLNCNAKIIDGRTIQVEHLAAYSFAFIRAKFK